DSIPRSLTFEALRQASIGQGGNQRQVTRGAPLPLTHHDFGAVTANVYFIHQLIYQENPATVVGVNVFSYQRTGDIQWIITIAGIPNHDQDAVLFIASDATID